MMMRGEALLITHITGMLGYVKKTGFHQCYQILFCNCFYKIINRTGYCSPLKPIPNIKKSKSLFLYDRFQYLNLVFQEAIAFAFKIQSVAHLQNYCKTDLCLLCLLLHRHYYKLTLGHNWLLSSYVKNYELFKILQILKNIHILIQFKAQSGLLPRDETWVGTAQLKNVHFIQISIQK